MEGAAVELWTVGLALAAILVVAVRDAGRPGNCSPLGLACLRAVGGLGLVSMALVALRSGEPLAAMIAAAGAAPLLTGLLASVLRRRNGLAPSSRTVAAEAPAVGRESPSATKRRAA